ncbi:hypothetical protein ACQRBJ_16290, partial [Prevotella sp. SGI.167]
FSNHPVPLSKEGSTAFPKPLSPQGTGDVTALRCSEPLRSMVGGPSKVSPDFLSAGASKEVSKVSPDCAGWDRLGAACLRAADGLADGAADGAADRLADGLAPIQVLVNVDIFSEGFDCPDVEFVQLARPT